VEEIEAGRSSLRTCAVLLCQLELPLALTVKALQVAHEEGVTTVLNTAPAPTDGAPLPDSLHVLVDIWCANEPELHQLTGMPVNTLAEVKAAAHTLVERGARCVLVTLGSRGALLYDGNSSSGTRRTSASASSESSGSGETPGGVVYPVEVEVGDEGGASVEDTSGAGDCFLGAFAHYLQRGEPLSACVSKANRVASLSVRKRGTQSSYPSRERLKALGLL
jgi:ribokinase